MSVRIAAIVFATAPCLSVPCQQLVASTQTAQTFDGQPLAANAARLMDALQYLGAPLPAELNKQLAAAIKAEDARNIQKLLDAFVLFHVSVNPELRVSVARGDGDTLLQQAGYTPILVKIMNDASVTRRLQILSPQAGPVYGGVARGSLIRQAQPELNENENTNRERRFLDVELFDKSPMTDRLSGHSVEYMLALIYSSEAGQREATIIFDLGQGTQDLGFRSELPVLFTVRPAMPVSLSISDFDGQPTTARLEFRDKDGRIYPPQAKRLTPDFFFQPQVYRSDGDTVDLPPGEFTVTYSRGPEYREQQVMLAVQEDQSNQLNIKLQRWVDPSQFGFYSGDHHIHGAGCSHYDNPTQGVTPPDMFRQVKGEGLNVGCVLTWGPCFDHQRNFFSPIADTISEPETILKYDLEISGFGSAALGHVCLLNLSDQTYPGSEGTATKGWPTWTVPVMRWAKEQGGVTGYPHSALHVDPVQTAKWIVATRDTDGDAQINAVEAAGQLLPESFATIDADGNGQLLLDELQASANRAADQLPNLAIPAMDGGGAMEIFVSSSEGVCDFISAMDTARIPEWNTWYHLLNCGFRLKLSGETDFPCMSSRRVGQGRVYVQLGDVDRIDFSAWCMGIEKGRSYVSDGYAHALKFEVNGISPGTSDVHLTHAGTIEVATTVAFSPELPVAVAYGTLPPAAGPRMAGDTVNLHAPRESSFIKGGKRKVELIVNGHSVAANEVEADGMPHEMQFSVPVTQSSWVAIRQFPELHTNPVNVIITRKPIRAARSSALWCCESVHRLWVNRQRFIRQPEREAALRAYRRSIQKFLAIAAESQDDGYAVPNPPALAIQE